MRLKEAIEESDIVETQVERYLLDLEGSDLELRLGVGQYGFNDDVACRALTHRLDGRAEVRQGDTHGIGILADVVPLLVMLQHEVAVVLVDLRLAVQGLDEVLVLLVRILGVAELQEVEDMYHLLAVEHRRAGIEGLEQGVVERAEHLRLLLVDADLRRMELQRGERHAVVDRIFLEELTAENNPIDQCVFGALADKEKTAGFEQQHVVLAELIVGHIDSSPRRAPRQKSIHTATDLTRIASVFIHQFTAGITNHIIAVRAVDDRDIFLFHLNNCTKFAAKILLFFELSK